MNYLKENVPREFNFFEKAIKDTVDSLEHGREQLFNVAENARNEFSRLNERLINIDEQLIHSEKELNSGPGLNRRNQLEAEKTDLEKNIASFRLTAEKAENLVSQVGMVIDFISGNLKDINLKIENLQQRQQLSLQIIKAQEEERRRMARDIHDGPAQSMANVVFRIEFCEKLFDIEPERVRSELRELKEVVRNNLQDVRKIIFDLRPMALDDLGVIPALKRYIDNFRDKNQIEVNLNIFGKDFRLESALEIAIFRLIQEALNNVIKHAGASLINVTLEMYSDIVTVSVEDNGSGFDPSQISQSQGNHYGLISMRERVMLLDGKIDIHSNPGQGTKITFRLPVRLRE